MRRTDTGRKVRLRACDFCHEPTHRGSPHAGYCIFGENGRFPLHGVKKDEEAAGLVVSDAGMDTTAIFRRGLGTSGPDIIICTPRQAEVIVRFEGDGARIMEAVEAARRRDAWASIK